MVFTGTVHLAPHQNLRLWGRGAFSASPDREEFLSVFAVFASAGRLQLNTRTNRRTNMFTNRVVNLRTPSLNNPVKFHTQPNNFHEHRNTDLYTIQLDATHKIPYHVHARTHTVMMFVRARAHADTVTESSLTQFANPDESSSRL